MTMTTTHETNRRQRLIDYIEDHGHQAEFRGDNLWIEYTWTLRFDDDETTSGKEWERVDQDLQSIREWLGY